MKFLERNFKNSSTRRTGMENLKTATHSAKLKGVIWKMSERKGVYRMTKWRAKERKMAPQR